MIKFFSIVGPVLLGSIGIMFMNDRVVVDSAINAEKLKSDQSLGCAPENAVPKATNSIKNMVILPGWGDHSYTVSTLNDSAQIYFNQGLSMYYSYHMREALASFKEAARFDSTCAMLYWAQALAMGPTYNFGYQYKMNPALKKVIGQMNQFAPGASAKEMDLIEAMNLRYNPDDLTDSKRKELNAEYAASLKSLVNKYPDDVDIKALYTDAVMLIHPWEFWNYDGSPKEWTTELVTNCEQILAVDPRHPAALHYYIHVTEASRKPEIALASADSLIKLFPGIAHMVHMSSHEYERIGYYSKGVHANEAADRSLVDYDSIAKGYLAVGHVPHYYAVDAYCALSGAMYKKAMPKTMTLRSSVHPTPENTHQQMLYMFPQMAMVRMGKWSDILSDTTSIREDWTYASILDDFAKGMAYAKTNSLEKAERHLQALRRKMKDEVLQVPFAPYTSKPVEGAVVAENILHANLLYSQGRFDEALVAINKAIEAEDRLLYIEPKFWMLPARQYLGTFLLAMKRSDEAEKVYREDLRWNPGNGWSLVGLYNSLEAQNKLKELGKVRKLYMTSFSDADEVPGTSAY